MATRQQDGDTRGTTTMAVRKLKVMVIHHPADLGQYATLDMEPHGVIELEPQAVELILNEQDVAAIAGVGPKRLRLLRQIDRERQHQDEQLGGPYHDRGLLPDDWYKLIQQFNAYALLAGRVSTYDPADRKKRLLQVAAVAIAAIEALPQEIEQ